jgi:Tol biopolymer transport system component
MALAPGLRIASYEILEPIGAGGMGEVYRARDLKLDRDVAIKILPELFASDPDRLARFDREAKALAALNHPNIAHIHGFEEASGVRALIMELAEGEDLAQRMRRGPVPLDEALAIGRQIAEALETAHERGIVHRDLKPANIKISSEGAVKILDFGLAKAVADVSQSVSPSSGGAGLANSPTFTSPRLSPGHAEARTEAGVILGTAAYMAPEQAKGKPVDRRADIWALGVVLFEMLTGRHLFDGETPTETIAQVIMQPPRLELLPAGTPKSVRRILGRCLEKEPRNRFQSAGDIRIELDEARTGAAEDLAPGPLAPARRVRPGWAWAIAGLIVGAAAGAAWSFWPAPANTSPPVRLDARLGGHRLVIDANVDGALAVLSPDGRTLVYAGDDQGTRRLYHRSLDESEAKPLPGTEGATSQFFSPDSRSIAFFVGGKLKRLSLGGGAAIDVADAIDARGGTWGAGDIIVFTPGTETGLVRVSASGGSSAELTTLATGERSHRWPVFLPDGRSVLFVRQDIDAAYDDATIEVVDVETGARTIVVRGGTFPLPVTGSDLLYVRGNTLLAQPFDASSLSVRGDPRPVLTRVLASGGVGAGTGNGSAQISISRTGTAVYLEGEAATPRSRLVVMDRSGKPLYTAPEAREFRDPRFSPDGNRVAVSALIDRGQHIFVLDLARAVMTRVTFDGTINGLPVWTPDGRELAFFSDRSSGGPPGRPRGAGLIPFITRADGGGEPRPLASSASMLLPMSFSADGRYLAVMQQGTTGNLDTLILDRSSGKLLPFGETTAVEIAPVFSPDGRWIAYQEGVGRETEVFVRRFPGSSGRWQISAGGGGLPAWSKHGREITYVAGTQDATQIMAAEVTIEGDVIKVGTPQKLFESAFFARPGSATWFDASPDGSRFAALYADRETPGGPVDHLNFIFNVTGLLQK